MSTIKNLIYVVISDKNIKDLVSAALKEENFDVMCFDNGASILSQVENQVPRLVILDWTMPDLSGLEVCGRIKNINKATKKVPVIMLSAGVDNNENDCILALNMGADDFLKKPFSVKELVSRVKAMLRRENYSDAVELSDEILTIGNLKINLGNRTVVKNGKFINLTMKEFDILVNLVNEKSKILTREQLMSRVWKNEVNKINGADSTKNRMIDARTVDVHIRYLRQKIEDNPDMPDYIHTVRGIGYRTASKEELASKKMATIA
jgi:two-component system alkaline phosphatase synthesis response regulator PhoP